MINKKDEFSRHEETFHPMGAQTIESTPPLIVWMSLQLAIP